MLIAREGSLNNYKQPPDVTESEPVSSFRIGAVKGEEMDSHTHIHTWTLETQLSSCLTVTQTGTSNDLTRMGSVEVTEAQGCRDCALGTPLSCPSSLNLHLDPLKNILTTILARYLRAFP